MNTATLNLSTLPAAQATDDIKTQVGYHNYYRVDADEAARIVTGKCPEGWRGIVDTANIRLKDLEQKGFAVRVGQVKPNTIEYPLYAYNIEAMQQHHLNFKVVYGPGFSVSLKPKV